MKKENMKKDWIKIVPQLKDCLDNADKIKCPDCGKYEIEYLYIGDEQTRIGYLQIWCRKCLKGIYISRVTAPQNAKFATFDENIENLVPQYDIVKI